ncbi:IPT/TIG domain-containing protein [Maribellus sediminis]|uniref:IPT/TIG domain-containing protein n=1 Tax=Maribellus sediminis TaxID=2696285 RepID=UPI0014302C6D|nr:IPT/TIG domain-containing protein [Maribellus sediminis]
MKHLIQNTILAIVLAIVLSTIFTSCKEEEYVDREFPRLGISKQVYQNENGVYFNAEIRSQGSTPIIEKGFMYSTVSSADGINAKIISSDTKGNDTFGATGKVDLTPGKTYYVHAWARTADFLVYSERISFANEFTSPAPEIDSISPMRAKWGNEMKIFGKNFSFFSDQIHVIFNDNASAKILSCNDSLITVEIPEVASITPVNVFVLLYGQRSVSRDLFSYINPVILGYSPATAAIYDTVTVIGTDFPIDSDLGKVYFNSVSVSISEITPTTLKAVIPKEISNSQLEIKVELEGANKTFSNKLKIKPPQINGISPNEITTYNESFNIYGQNFHPDAAKNRVFIGDKEVPIISCFPGEITCRINNQIIPNEYVAVTKTLPIVVQSLDQQATTSDSLFINYKARWKKLNDFPGDMRLDPVSFSYEGKGYIGLGSYETFRNHYSDLWEYDPETDSWKELEPLPAIKRGETAWFVVDDKLYVCCGYTDNMYTDEDNLNEVWEFDITNGSWTQKSDFPGGARHGAFGFTHAGKGYLGGGAYGNYQAKTDFWEYDPTGDSWIQKNNIAEISSHDDIEAYTVDDKAFILGDYRLNSRDMWEYDFEKNSWNQAGTVPAPNRETTGFELMGKLYMGTGMFSYCGGTSSWFSFDPNSNAWTSITFEGLARKSAGSFAIGNYGYIVGGRTCEHFGNLRDVWQFDPSF